MAAPAERAGRLRLPVRRPRGVCPPFHNSHPDGIHRDVEREGAERLVRFADEYALVAPAPESPLPAVHRAVPPRVPLLERLHELPEVVHPAQESVPLQRDLGLAAVPRPQFPAVEQLRGSVMTVQRLYAAPEFVLGNGLALRHPDEQVEVVVEEGEGEDADAREARGALQHALEDLLVRVLPEEELRPGGLEDDVVVAGVLGEGSCFSHESVPFIVDWLSLSPGGVSATTVPDCGDENVAWQATFSGAGDRLTNGGDRLLHR